MDGKRPVNRATHELFGVCNRVRQRILDLSHAAVELSSLASVFDAEIVAVIQRCVDDGADVMYSCRTSIPGKGRTTNDTVDEQLKSVEASEGSIPVLHRFIEYGFVDAVRACLTTPQSIDFTVAADYGADGNFASAYQHFKTPLQLVCQLDSDEKAVAILEVIIERLERTSFHAEIPLDVVEWGNENGDEDELFLNNAGLHHRLSLFWPVVKNRVPYFRERIGNGAIPIVDDVFSFDWAQLSSEDQACFELENGVLDPSESLNRLSKEANPSIKDVEKCLRDPKVNVCFTDDDLKIYSTSLHWFVFSGAVECFEACLTVPTLYRHQNEDEASFLYEDRVDFSVLNRQRQSVLHMICEKTCPVTAKRMLSAVVHHIETHPADIVDWSQKNRQGLNFIDYACVHQKLSLFWPVVKDMPYYADQEQIQLHQKVSPCDWGNLSSEDQSCFALLRDEEEEVQ